MEAALASLFGLLSMFAYGFANAYAKPLSQQFNIKHLIFLRGCVLVLLLGILAVPYYGNLAHVAVALAVVGLGMAGYFPVLAFTRAIRISPLGIVAPITGTSTLITVLLAVMFLGVHLSLTQWLAAALVIGANIAMSTDIKNVSRSKKLSLSTGVPLALVATVGFGLFYFLLIPATKVLTPLLTSFLVELGITTAVILHIKLSPADTSLKQLARTLPPAVAINAALLGLGMLTFTIGVRYFHAGIVTVLSNSSALVTTVAGSYMFHEKLTTKDGIAGAVAIAGIAAISIF